MNPTSWTRVPIVTRSPKNSASLTIEQVQERLAGPMRLGRSKVVVTEASAMALAAVSTSVRLISGALANTRLLIRRQMPDGRYLDAPRTPLARVLTRRPNFYQTAWQFWRFADVCVLLRGNFFALKVTGANGQVLALIPMRNDRVRVEQRTADGEILYHYTPPHGATIVLTKKEVFHLFNLSVDGFQGVTPIRYARELLGESISMQNHSAATYGRGARVGGIMSTEKRLGVEGRKNISDALEEYRSGGDLEGKELILEDGMTYTRVGMTMQDMQYIDSRKLSRGEIFMLFGVFPHMVGDTEKSTSYGSGFAEQYKAFDKFTLGDHYTMVEDGINHDLLPDTSDFYAVYDRRMLNMASLKDRGEYLAKALQFGWINPDEARDVEEMNPRPGGDQFYPPPNMSSNEPVPDDTNNDQQEDDA